MLHMHDARDSKRKQDPQGAIEGTNGVPVDKLPIVPKNEPRDIPDEWRESVARHLAKWVKENAPGKTTREVATLLGMKQPTYVQLKNKKGSFGLHLLLQLREGFGIPIDDLMGLAPLKSAETPPPPRTREETLALAVEVAALIAAGATNPPEAESPPERPDPGTAPVAALRRRSRA